MVFLAAERQGAEGEGASGNGPEGRAGHRRCSYRGHSRGGGGLDQPHVGVPDQTKCRRPLVDGVVLVARPLVVVLVTELKNLWK